MPDEVAQGQDEKIGMECRYELGGYGYGIWLFPILLLTVPEKFISPVLGRKMIFGSGTGVETMLTCSAPKNHSILLKNPEPLLRL